MITHCPSSRKVVQMPLHLVLVRKIQVVQIVSTGQGSHTTDLAPEVTVPRAHAIRSWTSPLTRRRMPIVLTRMRKDTECKILRRGCTV